MNSCTGATGGSVQNFKEQNILITDSVHTTTPDNNSRDACTRADVGVCSKVFNITRVPGQTLSGRTLGKISDMLKQCCGDCGAFMLGSMTTELPHLDFRDIEKTDILFPVLGKSRTKSNYSLPHQPNHIKSMQRMATLCLA